MYFKASINLNTINPRLSSVVGNLQSKVRGEYANLV